MLISDMKIIKGLQIANASIEVFSNVCRKVAGGEWRVMSGEKPLNRYQINEKSRTLTIAKIRDD